MIETPEGDVLRLWDTPGFGDSARLAKRLAQSGNPIGWFLSEVWDRWRDRPFWSSQQAVRNVREHADVVLYLVNAAEEPGDAGYLEPEMRMLEWIGKPAIVLLNQVGRAAAGGDRAGRGGALARASRTARDRARRAGARRVRALLGAGDGAGCAPSPSRCPKRSAAAFARLAAAWRVRRMAEFEAAMAALAAQLARAACDREALDEQGVRARSSASSGARSAFRARARRRRRSAR